VRDSPSRRYLYIDSETRAKPPSASPECFKCIYERIDNPHNLEQLLFCSQCEVYYCNTHWDQADLHKPTSPKAHQHVKTQPHAMEWVGLLIDGPPHKQQKELHEKEMENLWFGIDVKASKSHVNSNLYMSFILSSQFQPHSEQFSSLISFVGPTGAGKSTIIVSRLLLGYQASLYY
jgi:ABC-type multidrug transport system fused ATPase/permease subunit